VSTSFLKVTKSCYGSAEIIPGNLENLEKVNERKEKLLYNRSQTPKPGRFLMNGYNAGYGEVAEAQDFSARKKSLEKE
jgi:hypothetical protein